VLKRISIRVINEIAGINRVCLRQVSTPPSSLSGN